MDVLHVAMECVPFSKVGGLADVVGALPGALRDAGIGAKVLTPYYPQVYRGEVGGEVAVFDVHVGGVDHHVRLLEAGPHSVLIDAPVAYDRAGVYDDPRTGEGFQDSLFRSVLMCQTARHVVRERLLPADVVHCHDNQSGLLPVYLADDNGPPTVFTIHNLAYQGVYAADQFEVTGLAPLRFFGHSAFEYHGDLSLMKTALSYAGYVTTVSPTYAGEIVNPDFGCGLDGVLRWLDDRLVGILNGIDLDAWDPRTDPRIASNYSVGPNGGGMDGKAECKRALQVRADLEVDPDVPLVGMVSRVTSQKGLDLVGALLPWLTRAGAQVVLLGSGDHSILDLFRGAAGRWPGRVSLIEGYDEDLAHQVYAGADIFCMPSRFEPCGLSQMYAMRYGAVPVATAIGGLKDTVLPFNDNSPDGTGVLSWWPEVDSLQGALEYALDLYREPAKFARVQANGMRKDFSWTKSAARYIELYEQLL
ncbi:MAG: glycogen synthase GlgA [Planctomycetota bacterium]|jgi:starch synthase